MTAQLVQPACLPEAVERIRQQFDPVRKDIVVTTPEEIAECGNTIGHVLRPTLRRQGAV
jgi:hypothetical protein